MCSHKIKNPCIYNDDVILCNDEILNKTISYALDDQLKIPDIIKIYKKDNLVFISLILIFIIIFMIIFIIFMKLFN